MRSLAIESLSVRGMRNLAEVDIEPGPRFNVVSGANGQGKTNLLEAIYVLCTSKSFRTARPGDLVAHGGDVASVRGRFREEDVAREQSVGVRAGARMVRIDAKRPPTLAAYAVTSPVVLFHPGAVTLSSGSGSERRRLLDRVALHLSTEALVAFEGYTRALRERQRALETRGVGASDLSEWEELVARHGAALADARAAAAEKLAAEAIAVFARIGAAGARLEVGYVRTAPSGVDEYRDELARRRAQDLRRGSASIGPHRDDLRIDLDGHPARGVASQGQHRAIVLALELAEIVTIGRARDVRPILLLDDVSSELDRERTAALFAFLREEKGQVFLSTTRAELIDTGAGTGASERRDFEVVAGRFHRVGG